MKGPIEVVIDYSNRRSEEPGPTFSEKVASSTPEELTALERDGLCYASVFGGMAAGGAVVSAAFFESAAEAPTPTMNVLAGVIGTLCTLGALGVSIEGISWFRKARKLKKSRQAEVPQA